MTPETINLLDKISFTTALLVAVYILYRDSRADLAKSIAENTENIRVLTTQLTGLTTQVSQLTHLVQLMLDYETRQLETPTKPLTPIAPKIDAPAR